ncbi:MAG TPA: hypothetical protein VFA10_08665 [Ktedonobacteraceae bacterium]|nr:hypothetical protein [Ktedonobacteraceae bacterium]
MTVPSNENVTERGGGASQHEPGPRARLVLACPAASLGPFPPAASPFCA